MSDLRDSTRRIPLSLNTSYSKRQGLKKLLSIEITFKPKKFLENDEKTFFCSLCKFRIDWWFLMIFYIVFCFTSVHLFRKRKKFKTFSFTFLKLCKTTNFLRILGLFLILYNCFSKMVFSTLMPAKVK